MQNNAIRRWFTPMVGVWLLLSNTVSVAAPASFEQAKFLAKTEVYFDRSEQGTLYCGCQWQWVGRSGGRVDLPSCDYDIRSEGQRSRAERIEWEHVVPASNFGRARQCWQDGGRANCNRVDPVFNAMEADLHNLSPSVGEINGDRSNFRFGVLPDTPYHHGSCDFKVDFASRIAEPRDSVKGKVARIYFYMHDHYDLRMSDAQQRLLMAWSQQHPVTDWELERNRRISTVMGHSNPFVTGAKIWKLGHKNSGKGAQTFILLEDKPTQPEQGGLIRGNKNSKVYHLLEGCPSYDAMSPRNIVEFATEGEAIQAGYRKAGNCR